ncbi:MAG TPA: FeoC-like transcriptional regulator [Spirochaetota bacterium]|jgi:predicted ArsR family transcriptional regulator|nr:FeoC-like transcriptional regulator [Spirochaetota bacterium]
MLSQILRYLKTHGEASASEIAIALKMDHQRTLTLLDELITKKRIEKYRTDKLPCPCGCRGCTTDSCRSIDIYKIIEV